MSDITRHELDAKLDALKKGVDAQSTRQEMRIEKGMSDINSKIDRFSDRVIANFDALRTDVASSLRASEAAEARAEDARRATIASKSTIISLILGTGFSVVAIVFAVWALSVAGMDFISNLLSRPTG